MSGVYGRSRLEAVARDVRLILCQLDLLKEYYKMPDLRTAQTDHPLVLEWLNNAHRHSGDFLKNLAEAALRADAENYRFVRPIVTIMRAKYPQYEASDAVKVELADVIKEWEASNS